MSKGPIQRAYARTATANAAQGAVQRIQHWQ